MTTRVSIIFPYVGDDDSIREKLARTIDVVTDPAAGVHTAGSKPLLVVARGSVDSGRFDKFERLFDNASRTMDTAERRTRGRQRLCDAVRVLEVWAVDTCQMWLQGFGEIIEDAEDDAGDGTTCVLQIPGDLKYVTDFDGFVAQLARMRSSVEAGDAHFAIGDFEVEPFRSKHLIDTYGTYPLLFNWFPEVARKLQELAIRRPRSEFFAARLDFLKAMLRRKTFAYEQTLAMLIHSVSDAERPWEMERVDLGVIGDYDERRGFREANDQVERMERMLKFLWRDLHGKDDFDVQEFARLDRRSTSIREAALVSLQNFLGKAPGR